MKIIFFSLQASLVLLFSCDSSQEHSNKTFGNRVEPVLNKDVYPILFPFNFENYEGYELIISSSLSLKDTLIGKLILLDSMNAKIPYHLDGGNWDNNFNSNEREIAILPKPVAFSTWYLLMEEKNDLCRLNLSVKDGREIVLFEKGDSLGTPPTSVVFKKPVEYRID